jgi:tRNA pseudouridine55 synthase
MEATLSTRPANHARRVERVPVHGVLLLDKPRGLSSNDALQKARRILNAKKAGHTGTLDPLAQGLLPLCFGEATKFSQDLLDADKTYEADVLFGVTTSTGDAEGEVLQTRAVTHDRAALEAVLQGMLGEMDQVPPMHSALKQDGVALYELARKGIEVERAARRVTVHGLELLHLAGVKATLRCHVSKGTYIRTLAEDIGTALGCGAHLVGLKRTAVGPLRLENAVTLEQLADAPMAANLLAPVDSLAQALHPLALDQTQQERVRQGQRLALADTFCGDVRMYGPDGFLGIGHLQQGRLQPTRILHLKD